LAKEHSYIVEKRFEEGIERSVDVVDAHLIYQNAKIDQLKILYEYYMALTSLYFVVGTPEDVINLISN
jgi:outer membrane protein TolC